jgi:hypothetical protein
MVENGYDMPNDAEEAVELYINLRENIRAELQL